MTQEVEDTQGICAYCSGDYPLDDMVRDSEGDLGCTDCTSSCESCGTVRGNDDMYYSVRDQSLCGDCCFSCSRCGDYDHTDHTFDIDGESWCQDCYENHSHWCESCDTSYSDSQDYSYVDDILYCSDCFSQYCYYCEDCDSSYRDEDLCEHRDGSTPTTRNECGCRGDIHQYSCKPSLTFRGESKHKLYMGFELETEIRSGDVDGAAKVARLALVDHAILKHDSSIGRAGHGGFEIVTQPATLEYYRDKSDVLWDTIDTLRREYKARSWDTQTCGLHIHLSRAGFNGGAHLHRFIAFVYHNSESMMKFAGRKSSYARFNDVYTFDEYDRPVFSLAHKTGNPRRVSSERMTAVNTTNRDTIELRFFRGTMRPSGVRSALDLAHAMVEYTRDLRLDDVKMGALKWEWFADWVQDNNGIYPDLYDRIGKIASVSITNPVTMEA